MAWTEHEVRTPEASFDSSGAEASSEGEPDLLETRSAAAQQILASSLSVIRAPELEPGHEEPCITRKGRVEEVNGVLTHFCVECGRFARFGFGVRLRMGKMGQWYCREHCPTPTHSR